MTAVRGNLGVVGVPRLFRAIADERRTGRLTLTYPSGDQEGHVYFRRGDAYHARMLGTRVQLGTRLVSAGYLSHDDVDRALQTQKAEGGRRRLGEILVEEGMVPREAIEGIVKEQIEDTIFEILRWEDGVFEFEPDVLSDEDIGLQVSVENLVMEGARRFREWHQITRRIPSLDSVPKFVDENGGAIEVALTPEEWSLVSKVDGRSTVVELASMCGFTELEAARCVFGLVTAGLLTVELPAGVELPPEDRELEAVFDELERALEEASRDRSAEGQAPSSLEEIAAESAEEIQPESAEEIQPESAEEIQLRVVEEISPPEVSAEQEAQVVELEPVEEILAEELATEEAQAEEFSIEEELPSFEDLPVIDEAERSPAQPSGPGPGPTMVEPTSDEEPFYDHPDDIPTGHTLPEAELDPLAEEVESEESEEAPFVDVQLEPVSPVEEPEPLAAEEPETEPLAAEEPEPEPLAAEEPEPEPLVAQEPEPEPIRAAADEVVVPLPEPPEPELIETYSETQAPAALAPVGEVVAEETSQPLDYDAASLAHVFADLSTPEKERIEPRPVVKKVAEHEYVPPSEELPPRPAAPPPPIDPTVDTTALIREFSALGLEEAPDPAGVIEMTSRDRKIDKTDKSKGLFGRRKR